ncbi:hypothetical protein JN06_02561 [Bacteroides zoogleoformans]|nr:hypothetical protein JN06_02561 [Bacteroides zoogleoformans]
MQPIKTLSSYFKNNKDQLAMRTIGLGLLILCLCMACNRRHDHEGRIPLVELDGCFLYKEDLQSVQPSGLSKDDSLLFAEHYIRNWAEDVLLYDKAMDNIPNNGEIEKLVENYRRALIVHTYQQALIHQQLSNEISEQDLMDYYEKNLALFKVEYPLIRGLFIKVPLSAPQLSNVRRWYKTEGREAVEKLEKYSLQNAVKYEYFYDKWVPASDVLAMMPLNVTDVEGYLGEHRQIELKDKSFYYFLNVSDLRSAGEQAPYEFAHARVKDMLLNMKQVDFMKKVKDDLYQSAVKKDKIKYYLE